LSSALEEEAAFSGYIFWFACLLFHYISHLRVSMTSASVAPLARCLRQSLTRQGIRLDEKGEGKQKLHS
jgi:hypothetical protein